MHALKVTSYLAKSIDKMCASSAIVNNAHIDLTGAKSRVLQNQSGHMFGFKLLSVLRVANPNMKQYRCPNKF